MVSRAIYFIDGWITTNLRFDAGELEGDPERLAKRCIDDAAKRGISSGELEENLGTDLVDFISHELAITDVPGLPRTEKHSDPPPSVSGSDS